MWEWSKKNLTIGLVKLNKDDIVCHTEGLILDGQHNLFNDSTKEFNIRVSSLHNIVDGLPAYLGISVLASGY